MNLDSSTLSTLAAMAVLILMSAYFSATETAFSSLNKTRLKTLAEKGNRRAVLACSLAGEYDKLLSTILIGNNIVNIAASSLGTVLFVRAYGDAGVTISTAVVTVVVLIFGEISPKSVAKESPERFAIFSAPIIRSLMWVLTPVNCLFTLWKALLSKVFRVGGDRKMTQDELLMLVEEVEQEGSIGADECSLLRNAIEFTDREAGDILTHRVDLEAVPLSSAGEETAQAFSRSRCSRLLVYDGDIDHIVGVIHQKDFYTGTGVSGQPLKDIMTPPLFVPRSAKISALLKHLQKNKAHIAVVSDEYGGTLGIVTMEDILEELVGEIWDEHDEVVESFRQVGEGVYRIAGAADLEKMYQFLGVTGESDSASVSGWVMEQLGRIPSEGDRFAYGGLFFTVTAADRRRVLEIEARRTEADDAQEAARTAATRPVDTLT